MFPTGYTRQPRLRLKKKAAAVVRRIFAMTLEGYGPYQIAARLSADKIEIPSVRLARYGEGVNKKQSCQRPLRMGLICCRAYS